VKKCEVIVNKETVYVSCNTEKFLRNRCCPGGGLHVLIVCPYDCLRYPAFKARAPLNVVFCGPFGSKRNNVRTRVTEHKMCVLIFSATLSETFLIIRGTERDIIMNVHRYPCTVTAILIRF
jgi:hypothetical protein